MNVIKKVAAMVIKDNSFLMVRKAGKDIWTNLGGRPEPNESEEETLLREIKEEFDCNGIIMKKLGDFEAKAAMDNAIIHLSIYLVELNGDIHLVDPELEAYKFIDKDYQKKGIKLPESIEKHVLPYCIKQGLLQW